jgi:uncharacterized protein
MPATPAAKSAKNQVKTKTSSSPAGQRSLRSSKPKARSGTKALTSAQVLAWLQSHPAFFEENKDSLSTLAVPKKSGNILSLHAAKAEKSAADHARLAIRQKQLIAMAHSNALVAESLLNAMTNLIPVGSLPDLRTHIQTGLKKDLDLTAAKLYLTGKSDAATTLTAETIAELAPEAATLRSLSLEQAESLYGPIGKKLKSDCLLPLHNPKGKLIGLLALASDDATRFHAGQAGGMAGQFGRAVSAALHRIQSSKAK